MVTAAIPALTPELSLLKTIAISPHWSTRCLEKALATSGSKVQGHARKKLRDLALGEATELIEIDLVVRSPRQMGFTHTATYEEICEKALEQGLTFCPPEVGPVLRLYYTDQPSGDWLRISEDPNAAKSNSGIFCVGRHGHELWLGWCTGNPDHKWSVTELFVFVKPRA